MKTFFYCLVFFTACLCFNSCQQELSNENSSSAQGTLRDLNGNCNPSLVQGVYIEDTALTINNFIDASVNFSAPGAYLLQTDTINGYYFRGTGSVSAVGLQTIRLKGFGLPINTGTDLFHMRFDTSVCEVSVEVLSGTTPQAVFTLGSTADTCTGVVLAGTYISHTAMTATNTATLNVTVSSSGPYNITTPTVNGVYFSGAGVLSTSTTSIVLTAHGTPDSLTNNFTAEYEVTASASSTCSFSVTYTGLPAGPASFTFDCSTFDPFVPGSLRLGQTIDPAVNFITVDVNVLSVGTYSISSVVTLGGADGVNFNNTGIFTTTGIQTLTIVPHGTPQRAGFVFYNVSSPQSTNVNPCSTSAYYDFLRCNIASSFTRNFTFESQTNNDNTSVGGYDLIHMKGLPANGSTESLELTIGLPTGGSFDNTSTNDIIYTVNDFPSKYVKAVYKDASNPQVVYSAETNGTTQTDPFTITITFCTSGRIEGNFSGTVKDNNGAGPGTKTISGNFGLRR